MSEDLSDRVTDLLGTAEDRVASLADSIETVEGESDGEREDDGSDSVEDAYDDLAALEDVADEAEDLLSTVDVTDLAATIDADDLPDAVDPEDIPEAIREGEVTEAVDLRHLFDLSDLDEVWQQVEAREFWREKRELSDAIEDLLESDTTGDDETAASSDLVDGVDTDEMDVDASGGTDIDPRAIEKQAQMKVDEAVTSFRKGILEVHERLKETVAEREGQGVESPSSRNPTAVSTMTRSRSTVGGGTRHSTVPAETRYSSAPNHGRVYGDRFETHTETDDE